MSSIEVVKVSSKKQLMEFIKFPWQVYKDDPHWVPHLIMDRKKILDKQKNPFFEHGDADYFLAYKNGVLSGRIAAIRNDLHNQFHNDKVGFFGFFECFNDQEVANKLFDTARAWLKERGFDTMRGPASPSSNDEYGMLLKGFDDSPRLLMSYNPEYYNTLAEKYGFTKAKDLYAYSIENAKLRKEKKIERIADIARQRSGVSIREINMKDFKNELEKVKYVYNKAWAPNWGFVPMTDKEIDATAADLKQIVEPSIVLFAEIEGKVVGFALCMLDYKTVFKKMNGKILPLGWWHLITGKKDITWARIIILGIIPEFQKKGLDAVFYWEVLKRAEQIGILRGEASWILEDNTMMTRGAEAMQGEIYKTYRVYDVAV